MSYITDIQWSALADTNGLRTATVTLDDGRVMDFNSWRGLTELQRKIWSQNVIHHEDDSIPAVPRTHLDTSMREYAENPPMWTTVNGETFKTKGEPFYIYTSCGSRYKVQPEMHECFGFGMDRNDALQEVGIDTNTRDAVETAQQVTEDFMGQFSLRMMQTLLAELQRFYEAWELDRLNSMARNQHIYGAPNAVYPLPELTPEEEVFLESIVVCDGLDD